MEALLKRELGLSFVEANGQQGEGWISDGLGYNTDKGQIFAKINKKKEAKVMFDGELASLEAIIATDTVRVPKPMKVMDHPTTEGAVLAMEHLDMRGLSTYAAKLGEQLARMHLFNEELMKQKVANEIRVGGGCDVECVTRFGFPVATCCGIVPQDNEWCDDWVESFRI
ncbi:ketosamine-3-kinase-like [Patiria miniata]|uniref:protein-ribulosamine 3-kinase n=1 Tax=Patiria miniata TaxID=46514 RepID=A0A914AD47_PATMI|nr:ketosamine-3-kinase-like [Patiria miniata]XP_038061845.1 ketosamine-3-kinase-like [Patiria miniata]XP_038061846.1 ketosamine-3-kinase-like [Patiria miniata]